MQEAYPDIPSGIFTGNFTRPESNDLIGKPYPSGLVQRFEDLAAARYPDTPFYGHKEIDSGKGEREGFKGAEAVLQSRPPIFNFDWSNAPIPDPTAAARAAVGSPFRFGEGYGSAGEMPTPGAFTPFPGFRESGRFEDRTREQLTRDDLAALQQRGTSYAPGPEVAPTPLGNALGLEDLQRTAAPSLTPKQTLADQYREGTLRGNRGDDWLSIPQVAALKRQLGGEAPDINRLPVSSSDRVINDLAGALWRGVQTPGATLKAINEGREISTEDWQRTQHDESRVRQRR